MTDMKSRCLVCQASSDEIPLLTLEYQGTQFHICPQHLPMLIHKPQSLAGILPGAEKLKPHEHVE